MRSRCASSAIVCAGGGGLRVMRKLSGLADSDTITNTTKVETMRIGTDTRSRRNAKASMEVFLLWAGVLPGRRSWRQLPAQGEAWVGRWGGRLQRRPPHRISKKSTGEPSALPDAPLSHVVHR